MHGFQPVSQSNIDRFISSGLSSQCRVCGSPCGAVCKGGQWCYDTVESGSRGM